jgi:hypothetical protein
LRDKMMSSIENAGLYRSGQLVYLQTPLEARLETEWRKVLV